MDDAYDGGVNTHPPLAPGDSEPTFADVDEERRHRQRRLALGYRLFGSLHWGELGDGHISARDPERTDCFWLLRYGVPFGEATVDDLVLVGPGGAVLEGHGGINPAAYYIHMPVHDARPEIVCAAHTHTPYGTPWSAMASPFRNICQEAVAFHDDHAVFMDGEVDIQSPDGGKRIAAALGDAKLAILRSHGLLTVGGSVDEAIGWYLMAERVAEVHVKATGAEPISDEDAERCRVTIAGPAQGWSTFNWAIRSRVPDPTVVDHDRRSLKLRRFATGATGYSSPMESIRWKALSVGAGALGALLTRQAFAMFWPGRRRPPYNPADRRISWKQALVWGVSSGIGAGIARLVSQRGAAAAWEKATGRPPPGIEPA